MGGVWWYATAIAGAVAVMHEVEAERFKSFLAQRPGRACRSREQDCYLMMSVNERIYFHLPVMQLMCVLCRPLSNVWNVQTQY